eukprot:11069168-Alexandrium_andersonii.AAC.1
MVRTAPLGPRTPRCPPMPTSTMNEAGSLIARSHRAWGATQPLLANYRQHLLEFAYGRDA